MNLALSTILLFTLLLPGIFFRRFYYAEEFSKEYFKETFLEVFLSALIPSIFFQVTWYFITGWLGFTVDLVWLGDLVSSTPNAESFRHIQEHATSIVIYNGTMWVAAVLAGYLFRQVVRVRKWDRKYKHFRFQNAWHYILKGEVFDFERATIDLERDTVENIEVVFVDAVVSTSDGSIIYDGILVDYELSPDGGLETISLKEVNRRYLKNDPHLDQVVNPNRRYHVPGHMLILKYSEVVNLNFTYYRLVKKEDGSYDTIPVR